MVSICALLSPLSTCHSMSVTSTVVLLPWFQISQMDVEGVKVTALKVLFDILHSFGLDAFGVSLTFDTTEQTKQGQCDQMFQKYSSSSQLLINLGYIEI